MKNIEIDIMTYNSLEEKANDKNISVAELIKQLDEYYKVLELYSNALEKIEIVAEKEIEDINKMQSKRIPSEDSIPVHLILDDLTKENQIEMEKDSFEIFQAILASMYLKFQVADKKEIESSDIGEALTDLADKYFVVESFESWRKV